jgi:linoleoyl-CoA desaturase
MNLAEVRRTLLPAQRRKVLRRPSHSNVTVTRDEPLRFASEADRLASFQQSLDELLKETEEKLGAQDVAHIHRIRKLSNVLQVVGRTMLHVSVEPFSFGVGVATLSAHKALELMEIGHTVLHGAYDKLDGAEPYRSKTFCWRAPIDEGSWRTGHNVRHHQYTNIASRDPDLDFRGLRLSARIPRKRLHALQPFSNFLTWTGFANGINLHVTGMLDIYFPDGAASRDWQAIRKAHAAFLRKYLRYHAPEYVVYPALAGPFFWKVLLGNIFSEVARDVFAGAVIYCGHVGAHDYPPDTRAGSRAVFYVMQAEGAWNIDLPYALSVLAGGLDKQIEHHLFPRLPPNRLREVAPRVRAICEAHGVTYRSDRWPGRLRTLARQLSQLSHHGL